MRVRSEFSEKPHPGLQENRGCEAALENRLSPQFGTQRGDVVVHQ